MKKIINIETIRRNGWTKNHFWIHFKSGKKIKIPRADIKNYKWNDKDKTLSLTLREGGESWNIF